jgi:hypothetical protein
MLAAHENEHLQRVRRLDPRKDFGKSSKPSARNLFYNGERYRLMCEQDNENNSSLLMVSLSKVGVG